MMKYLISLFILMVFSTVQAEPPGTCVSDDEANLFNAINNYRIANGLPAVPQSNVLMTVGQWHAQDASINEATLFTALCNRHSWSNDFPNLWTGMCYTTDHAQAAQMWAKPSQISGGSFSGSGYENAGWGYDSIQEALAGWQNSSAHNDVILNQGFWTNLTWRSMGVGVNTNNTNYYYLWFSDTADNSPIQPLCSDLPDVIFNNGFEN
jgi:uncharacterized protein YkwD